LIEALYDGPARFTAVPYCPSRTWRLWRVSDCSEVRTWSNWTGSVPCWIGNVWPSLATGADGVPGCTSTKKLPSRKIRGLIANVASVWSGSPLCWIVIVTSAAWHWDWVVPFTLQWVTGEMFVTVPTLTPAIRTNESGRNPFALEKTA
jgi:hypothetical protein